MEIVYAAERDSIANLLSKHTQSRVNPEQIVVTEDPSETGSFYIGFDLERFKLTPSGELIEQTLTLLD
ncbi:MAG: hypothetical protein QNJ05_02545 [Woeseiaceae bacterium]|nr:hypothetical protein [Woeseiaceae bacterium]